MLLILANAADTLAFELAERWSSHDAVVATADDLSAPGWTWSSGEVTSDTQGTFVAGGARHATSELDGILVRIHAVFEHELARIAPSDRTYVAQEMTAFLRAWLAAAPCPVVNRPSSLSLSGPCWRTERWAWEAYRLGIPARPAERSSGAAASAPYRVDELTAVPVVGFEARADADPALAEAARRLARRADVELATVYFDGVDGEARFVGAAPTADLARAELADAVLERLTRGRGAA